MISELIDFYHELCEQQRIPAFTQYQNIKYVLNLTEDGTLVGVSPFGDPKYGRMVWVPALVGQVRTSKFIPQFLWDSPECFFGYIRGTKPVPAAKAARQRKKAREKFAVSRQNYQDLLGGDTHPAARAILSFYRRVASAIQRVPEGESADGQTDDLDCLPGLSDNDRQLLREGKVTTLLLRIDQHLAIEEDTGLPQIWARHQRELDSKKADASIAAHSILDGSVIIPAQTHNQIRIQGGQSAGAPLISFNADSFESYHLRQSENAPMSNEQQFAYVQALRYLLDNRNNHVYTSGDVTIVSWSKNHTEAGLLPWIAQPPSQEELVKWTQTLASGGSIDIEGIQWSEDDPCYFLCLTPNAARIVVRFFFVNTFGEVVENIRHFYDDIRIAGSPSAKKPSLYGIVRSTQPPSSKRSTSGSSLGVRGERLYQQLLLSVLRGAPLPYPLLTAVERRIRVAAANDSRQSGGSNGEKGSSSRRPRTKSQSSRLPERFDSVKAGLIKAFYLRTMPQGYTKEDFTVSLNKNNNHIPYLLGRLFYLYEWAQEEAQGKDSSSSIRRGFFSSASAQPSVAFPQVIRTAEPSLLKLKRDDPRKCTFLEKQIDDVMGRLPDEFPTHLTLVEQGQFYLGYYHQKQVRYTKKDAKAATDTRQ